MHQGHIPSILSLPFFTKSCLPRPHNRLCPVGHLQFAEDIGHVIGHRLLTEHQLPGNIAIAVAARDQTQDLAFPFRQFWKNLCRYGRKRRSEEINQPLRYRGTENCLTPANSTNSPQNLVGILRK